MEIKKIILRDGKQSLLGNNKEIIFDLLGNKKINIFLMHNSSGKSLIFNSLEHLFSFNKKQYIKKTNRELEVEIQFSLDGKNYIYMRNFYSFRILKDGEEVKDFGTILEKYLGIDGEKLEYYDSSRNSLYSLNRFNFLDFSTIFDKESSNEIPFIDARHDGISKKFILAYILGAKLDGGFFKKITEFEEKKEFVNEKKSKFEKHLHSLEQIQLIDNNIKDLFIELEDNRIIFGDLSVAIKHLKFLKDEYIKTFGNNDEDGDLLFLEGELIQLNEEKQQIVSRISILREEIKGKELVEESKLISGSTFQRKEVEEFDKYVNYKQDLEKFDDLKLSNYMHKNITPYITDFKLFLNLMYDIFVSKIKEKGLIDEDILESGNIIFKEDTLAIEALFKTSEGMRKALRVLSFIGLHIYSSKNETKCLDYSFYDSFIENIDYNLREALFDTIFDFIKEQRLDVPRIFFFITKIEKSEYTSIFNISDKYKDFINLIDDNGLKQ